MTHFTIANLVRSAKWGSDWSENELLQHKCSTPKSHQIHRSRAWPYRPPRSQLTLNRRSHHFSQETYRFLAYLDLASRANAGQESAIDDLAKSVLEVTGFDERGTILRTRYDIPFTICGDNHRVARTDVCLVHLNSMILLVVQEDKTNSSTANPEPQVIAEAIAAFQYNNRKREELGLPTLDKMTTPCIVMLETRPFFYKVTATQKLCDCVIGGQYPSQPTVVTRCSPPARRRASEGMEVPDYRRAALQYYDAFHELAKACWTSFLDGCE